MKNNTRKGPFLISPHKRNGQLTGNWLVNIPATFFGTRIRKYFPDQKSAVTYATSLERRYRRGEFSQSIETNEPSITFENAVKLWTQLQEDRVLTMKKKANSLETDKYRLKIILEYLGESKLTDISEEKLTEFQKIRLRSGLRPATVNSDVTAIKKVLNWAKRKDYLSVVPNVEKVPQMREESFLPTIAEVMKIIDALPDRLKPLVRFLAETGCRSGEAFNLTWDCIDLKAGTVDFKAQGGWTPKTSSSVRRIYIKGKIIDVLNQLPKNGDYVFAGKLPNKPIDNIKKAFASAVNEAKITRNGKRIRITPHTLRSAYATWQAVDNGVPEPVLQTMLGHAPGSQVTRQYYVKPQQEAQQNAVLQLP